MALLFAGAAVAVAWNGCCKDGGSCSLSFFCNLSFLICLAMLGWESRLALRCMRWAWMIGSVKCLSFLTSLAFVDVMSRPGSIVVMRGFGSVVVVA